ncbi:MAG: hypothetical protein LBI10_09200 [Deltaproteobacteria bacterium]|jgi:hypothetical protein|nr:hypothetical protein [Deltaproteobacteria bacterium]
MPFYSPLSSNQSISDGSRELGPEPFTGIDSEKEPRPPKVASPEPWFQKVKNALARRRRLTQSLNLAKTLSLTLIVALGIGLYAKPALATETECQVACQTGQAKLVAEKNKNQKREDANRVLKDMSQKIVSECFAAIYAQNYGLLGYPGIPNLSEALSEICRNAQKVLNSQDYSLPGFSFQDLYK